MSGRTHKTMIYWAMILGVIGGGVLVGVSIVTTGTIFVYAAGTTTNPPNLIAPLVNAGLVLVGILDFFVAFIITLAVFRGSPWWFICSLFITIVLNASQLIIDVLIAGTDITTAVNTQALATIISAVLIFAGGFIGSVVFIGNARTGRRVV